MPYAEDSGLLLEGSGGCLKGPEWLSLLTQIVIISHVVFLMHAFWAGMCFWMKSHLTFAYYRCHLFFPSGYRSL